MATTALKGKQGLMQCMANTPHRCVPHGTVSHRVTVSNGNYCTQGKTRSDAVCGKYPPPLCASWYCKPQGYCQQNVHHLACMWPGYIQNTTSTALVWLQRDQPQRKCRTGKHTKKFQTFLVTLTVNMASSIFKRHSGI